MTDLIKLAERVEALDGPDRDMFKEAAAAIWHPFYALPVDWDADRYEKHNRFDQLVENEAWLSAAEMLVPEEGNSADCIWNIEVWSSNGVHAPHVRATAWVRGAERVYAATPALALTAAALRARSKT